MHILRPAGLHDLNAFYNLALKSSLGLTNFPKDKELLRGMLKNSEESFAKEVKEPNDEIYIFALERVEDSQVVGSCMVRANVPHNIQIPYFSKCSENNLDMIRTSFETEGMSELCGLYLDPGTRGAGLGKLLSISRFFYIADHLKRFMNKIFAEIHGFVNEEGDCPFWEGIMRPFIELTFPEAVLFYIKDPQAFSQKMPKTPIYCDLLPKDIRESIGAVHPKSLPALSLLQHEGFGLTRLIHPLDGGPRIEGLVRQIRGIQKSGIYKVEKIGLPNGSPPYLIATTGKKFRSMVGELSIVEGSAHIDAETAKALQLEVGELCRILPLH